MAALQNYALPFLSQPLMAQGQSISAGGHGDDSFGPGGYSLPPMDNLRSKNDLMNLSEIFSTMQSTIYDNPNEIAAAGVGQPGGVPIGANAGYRNSNSPPGIHLPQSHAMPAATPSSHHSSTPALTPPSSAASNTSGNSPPSMHLNTMSPTTPGGMYPTLPGPSTSQGYMSSNMAPTSTLGSQFDHDQRRRHSGGRLMKAAPANMRRERPEDAMDTSSEGATTPKNAIASSPSSASGTARKRQSSRQANDFSNMNLDPALGGATSPGGEISEEAVKANEMWVGNIRVIEALKAWVTRRLETHDYESDEDDAADSSKGVVKEQQEALYPVLNNADHE